MLLYGVAGRLVGWLWVLNYAMLWDTAPEMKCYQKSYNIVAMAIIKWETIIVHLFHCHVHYGEILAPWVGEGDYKSGVYPKWLRGFFCVGCAEEQQPQQILIVWILGAQLRDTAWGSRQSGSLKNLRTSLLIEISAKNPDPEPSLWLL